MKQRFGIRWTLYVLSSLRRMMIMTPGRTKVWQSDAMEKGVAGAKQKKKGKRVWDL